MIVTGIRVSDWDKEGVIVKVSNVTFDDGREVPGYDLPAGLEEGKPLPDGWEVATAKSGKLYIKPPKANKGAPQAAFRNTKEGQAIEQDAMNRRTALMQAVAVDGTEWRLTANEMYAWLQKSGGTGSGEKTAGTKGTAPPTSDWGAKPVSSGEGTGKAPCSHKNISDRKPDDELLPRGFVRCVDCGDVFKG